MSRLMNIIFGWEEVLVTQDQNYYMKLKSDLDSKGISTRSEFVNARHKGIGSIGNGTYYLYVKKEEKVNK